MYIYVNVPLINLSKPTNIKLYFIYQCTASVTNNLQNTKKPSFNNFLSPFLQFPPSFLIGTPVQILRTDGLYPYSTWEKGQGTSFQSNFLYFQQYPDCKSGK